MGMCILLGSTPLVTSKTVECSVARGQDGFSINWQSILFRNSPPTIASSTTSWLVREAEAAESSTAAPMAATQPHERYRQPMMMYTFSLPLDINLMNIFLYVSPMSAPLSVVSGAAGVISLGIRT